MKILDYKALQYAKDKEYSAVILIFQDLQSHFGIALSDIDQALVLSIMKIPGVWRPRPPGYDKSK